MPAGGSVRELASTPGLTELDHAVDLLVLVLPGEAPRGRPATRHDPIPARAVLAAWCRVACRVLSPRGRLVVVTNSHRYRGQLVDLPGEAERIAQHAGLIQSQRVIALLDPTGHGIEHGAQPTRIRGVLVFTPLHADVLVFTVPTRNGAAGVVRR